MDIGHQRQGLSSASTASIHKEIKHHAVSETAEYHYRDYLMTVVRQLKEVYKWGGLSSEGQEGGGGRGIHPRQYRNR